MALKHISDKQARILKELCSGLIPPDREGDATFHDLTVAEMDSILDAMSGFMRFGVRLLMFTFNWLTVLIVGRLKPASSLSLPERNHYIERLENNRFYLIRLLIQIAKSLLLMCYYARDDVEKKLGYINTCLKKSQIPASEVVQ